MITMSRRQYFDLCMDAIRRQPCVIKKVAFDETPNGYRVSTVLLGDLFETMVFPRNSWGDVYCERTRSATAALNNHAVAYEQFKSREG
jgi:hypothetical protein